MRARASRLARALVGGVRSQPVIPAGRRTRLGGMVLLAVLAVGSATALTVDRIYAVPTGAAFRVGDTLVTEQQLSERVTLLGALYGVRQPVDPAGLDRFRRDSAKAVAMSEVLDEAARARGIVIADKTANDQLTTMLERSFPDGRDMFVTKLRGIGLTEQAVLDEIKRQLSNARLYEQVTQDVPVPTEQEVAATYQQRRAEMAIPEKRHLRNIVVSGPDQAAQVRGQLDGGADFVTLARQASLDDSTKAGGGDLGTVARSQLEKAYGDAAFGAGPNTVFGPVQTQYGWNVGQVLTVSPAVPLSLDQVRAHLQAGLLEQRKLEAWNRWLAEQLRSAQVRYADAYRPANPEAAVPEPAAPR